MAGSLPKSADGRPLRPQPKGGSRKGKPNKITADVKAMVLGALSNVGGVKYLEKQANVNPSAFLGLVGKCMPKEVTGADGRDLVPDRIILEFVGK